MKEPLKRALRTGAAMLAAFLLLSACTGINVLESNVTAFANWPQAPVNATYRFERLPSQAQSPLQERFEGMVQAQLDKAGWRRDEAGARYAVQIGVRGMREMPLPWNSGFGLGFRGRYGYSHFSSTLEFPDYRREVSVLIRELAGNRVVFETHAWHDTSWSDSDAIWNATFAAALYGFPNTPPGPHAVGVQLPP